MKRRTIFAATWLLLAIPACASTSGKSVKQPGGFDRNAESGEKIASLLNDNPWAVAHRAGGGDDSQLADQSGDDEQKKAAAEEKAQKDAEAAKQAKIESLMKQSETALAAKDYDGAMTAARSVIELDPKGYPYAFVVLGDAYARWEASGGKTAHDYGKALESYKKAMELDPNDGWAANRASQALLKLKQPTAARDLLRKFVDGHPDVEADTLDALAWIELDLGDWKKASAAFDKAIKASNGKDAEAYYGLAMIAARKNDPNATEKNLAALFELEPDRRVVIERDPTFFKVRMFGNVKALFSDKKMAEAKKAADDKKKGISAVAIGGGPPLDKTDKTDKTDQTEKPKVASVGTTQSDASTKLAIPGGEEKTIAEQIRFDFDSAKIKPESNGTLDAIAEFLKGQLKSIDSIEIEGHADKQGEPSYNLKLSESRAMAVKNALVVRGIPASKLSIKGYGAFCPMEDSDGEDAFAKNRRVQFAISAGGKVYGDELSCTDKMRKWLKPGLGVKVSSVP